MSSPTSSVLSSSTASLHYVTTTLSVSGESIVKHLRNQQGQLEKKSEKVLSAFETADYLVLEMEVTMEFKTSGGHFLPGLDDNFVVDNIVTFPMVSLNGTVPEVRLSNEVFV